MRPSIGPGTIKEEIHLAIRDHLIDFGIRFPENTDSITCSLQSPLCGLMIGNGLFVVPLRRSVLLVEIALALEVLDRQLENAR